MKIFFISIFVGLSIVLLVKDHPGYVLINYPPWVFETALPVFVFILVLTYFITNYLVRVIGTFLFVRKKWGSWQKRRLGLRAQASLALGLMKNWSGQWRDAEKVFVNSAAYSAYPGIHFIGAAYAAHQQSRYAQRDHFLDMAKQHVSEKDVPNVEYTHAELYVQSGQAEKAVILLKEIQANFPKDIRVARLLAQCFHMQEDWESLWQQIKHMRHYRMLEKADFQELEIETIHQLLQQKQAQQENSAVQELWSQIPKPLKQHNRVLPLYIHHLIQIGQSDQAQTLLHKAIKNHWDNGFVELYGMSLGADTGKQLQIVEKWINKNPKNAVLLHAAARLCIANRLWGKARNYLEASLGIQPTQIRFKELGELLEQMGDAQASLECFKKGLKMAANSGLVINGHFSQEQDNLELRIISNNIKELHEDAKSLSSTGDKLLVNSSKE